MAARRPTSKLLSPAKVWSLRKRMLLWSRWRSVRAGQAEKQPSGREESRLEPRRSTRRVGSSGEPPGGTWGT